jgi:hypothetical protein
MGMNDLRQRTFWALLQNAVFSPLSGLIIALAILLIGLGVGVPVVNAPPYAWLVGLAPLWLVAVAVNVVSKQAGEQAASQVMRDEYDITRIANPHLRTVVSQAVAYRERIDKAVGQFDTPAMRGRLQDVANQVDEWVGRIYTLARRLDTYRNDSIISNDMTGVPQAIKQLQVKLNAETDASVKQDIQDTIARRQEQFKTLRNLDNAMDRAELQLENTLTALGTVYSQMLLLDARDVDSAKTQRLRDSIADQLASLTDIQSSLDEVYQTGNHQSQTAHR